MERRIRFKTLKYLIPLLFVTAMIFWAISCSDIAMRGVVDDVTTEDPVYNWVNTATLSAPNPSADQNFGKSVDIHVGVTQSYVAVGAPEESSRTGAVYIFKKSDSGWTFMPPKITASDGSTQDLFGHLVKFIDHETLIIAAPGFSSNEGGVYVYELNGSTWETPASLTDGRLALPSGTNIYFGVSIEVSTSNIFVGDLSGANFNGAAFVYSAVDYTYVQTLTTGGYSIDDNDRFGSAIAATDSFLFVGAYNDDDNTGNAGAVYMYRNSGNVPPWLFVKKFQSPSPESDEYFGKSLSLYAETLLIGEPGAASVNAQKAHLYEIVSNNVSHLQTFEQADANISQFGEEVDIYGDYLLISDSSYKDVSHSLNDIGKTFFYKYQNGDFSKTAGLSSILKSQPADGDKLGFSTDLNQDIFCIGIPGDDLTAGETNSGSVLVYEYIKTN